MTHRTSINRHVNQKLSTKGVVDAYTNRLNQLPKRKRRNIKEIKMHKTKRLENKSSPKCVETCCICLMVAPARHKLFSDSKGHRRQPPCYHGKIQNAVVVSRGAPAQLPVMSHWWAYQSNDDWHHRNASHYLDSVAHTFIICFASLLHAMLNSRPKI